MTAPTAPGARRRLQRLTTDSGRLHVIALDHRDSLRRELAACGLDADADHVRRFKREVLAAATPYVSGVMLDPEWAWPAFATEGCVDRGVGVICALEAQGYDADPLAGNRWLDGWNPALLAASGADAAKLLVLYRPDGSDHAAHQEALVRRSVEACAALELPIFVEPVPFGIDDPAEHGEAVVRTAERFAGFGPMVLKLPYPGDAACERLTDACAGTPWALLSWGVGFEQFADQLEHATAAGCGGYMVGRAVWREALDPAVRPPALAELIPERMQRLASISHA
jgi:tagatose-1,6-bisphosphate aldolase